MATLLQRLDAEVATFTDNFANLVKASRVSTPDSKKNQVQLHADLNLLCIHRPFSLISYTFLKTTVRALCYLVQTSDSR